MGEGTFSDPGAIGDCVCDNLSPKRRLGGLFVSHSDRPRCSCSPLDPWCGGDCCTAGGVQSARPSSRLDTGWREPAGEGTHAGMGVEIGDCRTQGISMLCWLGERPSGGISTAPGEPAML